MCLTITASTVASNLALAVLGEDWLGVHTHRLLVLPALPL